MKLDFIKLDNLKISPLNVRKHGDINGDDLIPSIKANGILQPLLVRPNCKGFDVIAGQRRLLACQKISKEQEVDSLPCAIMEDGDDAKAIEASLAENIARLPMDEIDQYEAFLALFKTGQTVEEIASHFGVTERLVKQRLAIANLYDPILNAYRREEIQPSVIRLLTLATPKQQKEWYKLFKKDEEPPYYSLKSWLFGGDSIPTENALFDLKTYKGVITSDLFGDESYFADSKLFWEHQSQAIAAIKADYEEDGWKDVIILDVGEHWSKYEHVATSKEDGGKVFISVKANGEVFAHAGLLHEKEAKRLKMGKDSQKQSTTSERPELTKVMENYLNLHRHAAVRAELLKHPDTALRVTLAQMIAGSSLWTVHSDPQKANTEAIRESLATNKGEDVLGKEREAIRKLLDFTNDDVETIVTNRAGWGNLRDLDAIFKKLLELDNESVARIFTFVAAETLPCGSELVERLGDTLAVDMADYHKPDETFLDLLRDKEAINEMLKHIGGKAVAEANITATAKVQKNIIRDFLTGNNNRKAKPEFEPRYFRFPMQGYTKRMQA